MMFECWSLYQNSGTLKDPRSVETLESLSAFSERIRDSVDRALFKFEDFKMSQNQSLSFFYINNFYKWMYKNNH